MDLLDTVKLVTLVLGISLCAAWSESSASRGAFLLSSGNTRSRRAFLSSAVILPVTTASVPAFAVSQVEEDRQKMFKGYERLGYLLDNWERETTVCKTSNDNPYLTGGGCERTPLKVMDYMGYKSTNDPLFKAEKTLRRLESLVPGDRAIDFVEAGDELVQALDEASGMAFVSSWGEANPGGGKDRVEYFIERSKRDVVKAHDSLSIIVDILK